MNSTNKKTNYLNRRQFLGYSALGLAGLTILPSWAMVNGVRMAPSDRVVMGFIGLGQQSFVDFRSYQTVPGVQVAAGSDVDSIKCQRFKNRIGAWQTEQNVPQKCDTYEFYQEMLERQDIDAVHVTTPDHWHALALIHSCQAKKDVYVQKPLCYTITESIAMVKAARDNNCVVQVGSQQRSGKEFQLAFDIVRSRAIGNIETIWVRVGAHPTPYDLPEEPIPANLNFNQWLGPLNDPKVHHNSGICQPISLNPETRESGWGRWRYYRETGNGYTADWGAHHFDIANAAIGMDGLGPVEFIPIGYRGTEYLTMKYQNGVVMTEQSYGRPNPPVGPDGTVREGNGISFNGSKGWVKVTRNYIECSDPSLINIELTGGGPENAAHAQNFIDAVRSRKKPIAPIEVGASSLIICVLANIANELQRPVKWDPATLTFAGGDKEAENHRLYRYEYRKPYASLCTI